METSRHDPLTRRTFSRHVLIGQEGVKFYSVLARDAWPANLDLMLAELDLITRQTSRRLRERWSDWQRDQFTVTCTLTYLLTS